MGERREPDILEAGQGPALVFLHGWTMDGHVFANQFARLKDRFYCIAPHLPGHGPRWNSVADLDAACNMLTQVIKTRTSGPVTIVGWSMGAMVAWQTLAANCQLDVAGLISVDMSPKLVNDTDWHLGISGFTANRNRQTIQSMKANWPRYAPRIGRGMFANPDGPSDLPFKLASKQIRDRDSSHMISMWESLTRADARQMISALTLPSMIITGARSRIYSRSTGIWLRDNMSAARLHVMEKSGHSPHLEEPDKFACLVAEFASENLSA